MVAIIEYDVAKRNNKILQDTRKCRNIGAVAHLLYGSIQVRNDFGVISVYVVLNIAPQKRVTCVLSEEYSS